MNHVTRILTDTNMVQKQKSSEQPGKGITDRLRGGKTKESYETTALIPKHK